MTIPPTRIAILGAGPAACTLAALLSQRGAHAVVFDAGVRPEMIVGESLIPAVVPLLRRLGIEERVAAISQHKPGVSFLHESVPSIDFNFSPVAPYLPTYAYNVERHSFDALLKQRAIELGAVFLPVAGNVVLSTDGSGRELALDEASLAAVPAWNGQQPDLLIDATGRTRLFAKVLGIGATNGKRDDVAYFAHYENFAQPQPAGQVLISRLQRGWSWRIPLPNQRMSFGLVISPALAKTMGETPADRLATCLQAEPLHQKAAAAAQRVTNVAVYRNYQRIGHRAYGPGWAAVGDAFGFVDPMLSSGLFLAMEAADQLDAAIPTGAYADYEFAMREWYAAWEKLIDYFYDGRIFSLYQAGFKMRLRRTNALQHGLDRLLNKHIACMAAGALTRATRSQAILSLAARFLIGSSTPAEQLAIR